MEVLPNDEQFFEKDPTYEENHEGEDEDDEAHDEFEDVALNFKTIKDTWIANDIQKQEILRELIKCFGSLVIDVPKEYAICDDKGRYRQEDLDFQKLIDAPKNVIKAKRALLENENFDSREFTLFIKRKLWVRTKLRPTLELCAREDSVLARKIIGLSLILLKKPSDRTVDLLSTEVKRRKSPGKYLTTPSSSSSTAVVATEAGEGGEGEGEDGARDDAHPDSQVAVATAAAPSGGGKDQGRQEQQQQVDAAAAAVSAMQRMSALGNAREQMYALLAFKEDFCSEKCNEAVTNCFRESWAREINNPTEDHKQEVAVVLSFLRRLLAIECFPDFCQPKDVLQNRIVHSRFIVQLQKILSVLPGISGDLMRRKAYHTDWLTDVLLILYFTMRDFEADELFQVWKNNALVSHFLEDGGESETDDSSSSTSTSSRTSSDASDSSDDDGSDEDQRLNKHRRASTAGRSHKKRGKMPQHAEAKNRSSRSGSGSTKAVTTTTTLKQQQQQPQGSSTSRVGHGAKLVGSARTASGVGGGSLLSSLKREQEERRQLAARKGVATARHGRFGGAFVKQLHHPIGAATAFPGGGLSGGVRGSGGRRIATPSTGSSHPLGRASQSHTSTIDISGSNHIRNGSLLAGFEEQEDGGGTEGRQLAKPQMMVVTNPFASVVDFLPQARRKRGKKSATFALGSGCTGMESTQVTDQVKQSMLGGRDRDAACAVVATLVEHMASDVAVKGLVLRINEDLRRDEGMISSDMELRYFEVLTKILGYNRLKLASRYQAVQRASSTPSWEPDLKNVMNALDRMSFTRVTVALEVLSKNENRRGDVVVPMRLLKEMVCYLRVLLQSSLEGHHEIAVAALYRLFYASATRLDPLPKLFSEWKPGVYSRAHLIGLVELAHESLKTLDAASALYRAGGEKSESMRKKLNSKAARGQKEMDMEQYVLACMRFDVDEYFKRIVTNHSVRMYTRLLSEYKHNDARVNHHVYTFMQRMCSFQLEQDYKTSKLMDATAKPESIANGLLEDRVNLGYMLFNIQTLSVANTILNDRYLYDRVNNPTHKQTIPLLRLMNSLVRMFGEASKKNRMLFVEALFQHARAHEFCCNLDSVYEAPAYAILGGRIGRISAATAAAGTATTVRASEPAAGSGSSTATTTAVVSAEGGVPATLPRKTLATGFAEAAAAAAVAAARARAAAIAAAVSAHAASSHITPFTTSSSSSFSSFSSSTFSAQPSSARGVAVPTVPPIPVGAATTAASAQGEALRAQESNNGSTSNSGQPDGPVQLPALSSAEERPTSDPIAHPNLSNTALFPPAPANLSLSAQQGPVIASTQVPSVNVLPHLPLPTLLLPLPIEERETQEERRRLEGLLDVSADIPLVDPITGKELTEKQKRRLRKEEFDRRLSEHKKNKNKNQKKTDFRISAAGSSGDVAASAADGSSSSEDDYGEEFDENDIGAAFLPSATDRPPVKAAKAKARENRERELRDKKSKRNKSKNSNSKQRSTAEGGSASRGRLVKNNSAAGKRNRGSARKRAMEDLWGSDSDDDEIDEIEEVHEEVYEEEGGEEEETAAINADIEASIDLANSQIEAAAASFSSSTKPNSHAQSKDAADEADLWDSDNDGDNGVDKNGGGRRLLGGREGREGEKANERGTGNGNAKTSSKGKVRGKASKKRKLVSPAGEDSEDSGFEVGGGRAERPGLRRGKRLRRASSRIVSSWGADEESDEENADATTAAAIVDVDDEEEEKEIEGQEGEEEETRVKVGSKAIRTAASTGKKSRSAKTAAAATKTTTETTKNLKRQRRGEWSAEEDAALREQYALYAGSNSVFTSIAHSEQFGALGATRSASQIERRVRQLGLHLAQQQGERHRDGDSDSDPDLNLNSKARPSAAAMNNNNKRHEQHREGQGTGQRREGEEERGNEGPADFEDVLDLALSSPDPSQQQGITRSSSNITTSAAAAGGHSRGGGGSARRNENAGERDSVKATHSEPSHEQMQQDLADIFGSPMASIASATSTAGTASSTSDHHHCNRKKNNDNNKGSNGKSSVDNDRNKRAESLLLLERSPDDDLDPMDLDSPSVFLSSAGAAESSARGQQRKVGRGGARDEKDREESEKEAGEEGVGEGGGGEIDVFEERSLALIRKARLLYGEEASGLEVIQGVENTVRRGDETAGGGASSSLLFESPSPVTTAERPRKKRLLLRRSQDVSERTITLSSSSSSSSFSTRQQQRKQQSTRSLEERGESEVTDSGKLQDLQDLVDSNEEEEDDDDLFAHLLSQSSPILSQTATTTTASAPRTIIRNVAPMPPLAADAGGSVDGEGVVAAVCAGANIDTGIDDTAFSHSIPAHFNTSSSILYSKAAASSVTAATAATTMPLGVVGSGATEKENLLLLQHDAPSPTISSHQNNKNNNSKKHTGITTTATGVAAAVADKDLLSQIADTAGDTAGKLGLGKKRGRLALRERSSTLIESDDELDF